MFNFRLNKVTSKSSIPHFNFERFFPLLLIPIDLHRMQKKQLIVVSEVSRKQKNLIYLFIILLTYISSDNNF